MDPGAQVAPQDPLGTLKFQDLFQNYLCPGIRNLGVICMYGKPFYTSG